MEKSSDNFLKSLSEEIFSLLFEREEGRERNIDWLPLVSTLTGKNPET